MPVLEFRKINFNDPKINVAQVFMDDFEKQCPGLIAQTSVFLPFFLNVRECYWRDQKTGEISDKVQAMIVGDKTYGPAEFIPALFAAQWFQYIAEKKRRPKVTVFSRKDFTEKEKAGFKNEDEREQAIDRLRQSDLGRWTRSFVGCRVKYEKVGPMMEFLNGCCNSTLPEVKLLWDMAVGPDSPLTLEGVLATMPVIVGHGQELATSAADVDRQTWKDFLQFSAAMVEWAIMPDDHKNLLGGQREMYLQIRRECQERLRAGAISTTNDGRDLLSFLAMRERVLAIVGHMPLVIRAAEGLLEEWVRDPEAEVSLDTFNELKGAIDHYVEEARCMNAAHEAGKAISQKHGLGPLATVSFKLLNRRCEELAAAVKSLAEIVASAPELALRKERESLLKSLESVRERLEPAMLAYTNALGCSELSEKMMNALVEAVPVDREDILKALPSRSLLQTAPGKEAEKVLTLLFPAPKRGEERPAPVDNVTTRKLVSLMSQHKRLYETVAYNANDMCASIYRCTLGLDESFVGCVDITSARIVMIKIILGKISDHPAAAADRDLLLYPFNLATLDPAADEGAE